VRRAWAIAAAVALLAVAGMLWLLATRKPAPPVPGDAAHAEARGEGDCLECHDLDGPAPRGRNHPISQRCFQCHAWG
jgi:hypothetical protein